MFDDKEEFVVLTLPKTINGVDFIQSARVKNGYVVQVGSAKEDDSILVEKIYTSQMEVEKVVYKFYEYGVVDNIEEYKPVEYV